MTALTENNAVQRRRGCRNQLFRPDLDHNMLHDNSINSEHNSRFWNKIGGFFSFVEASITMNKSAKTALIAIAILVWFCRLLIFCSEYYVN